MSKKILILGRSHHPDGKETADDLFNALAKLDKLQNHQVVLAHYKDLVFDINTSKVTVIDSVSGHDLSSFDAVLMTNWFSHASIRKDIAYALGLYWENKGVTFFNTESRHNRSSSKLSQMMIAALSSVSVPHTIFSLSFDRLLETSMKELGFPVVFKDAQASRGKGNHLIHSHQDAISLKTAHTEKNPFIAQQFIDSGMEDYRFFVAGGKARFIIKRIGDGSSHLTNTSAGASTEVLQPDELGNEVLTTVEDASRLLHREVTGVDIIVDRTTKKSYFLEANPIPQIATGSNVQRKIEALSDALIEATQIKEE